jgi:hypothetical protein
MKSRLIKISVAFSLGMICAIASLASFRIHPVLAQGGTPNVWQHPGKLIDERARIANPEDKESIREVANQIFNYPHAFGRMPAEVEASVKEKLVIEEMSFRSGRRPGISEDDVVLVVNRVGNALNLPSYARTTQKQVRTIRMSLMFESPAFMASGMLRPDMRIGESISSEMSILQATHVAQVLLDQKFINPDFQADPNDWDQNFHKKALEKIQKSEDIQRAGTSNQITHHISARENSKHAEMSQAFFSGASSLSAIDGLELVKQLSRDWKIGQ